MKKVIQNKKFCIILSCVVLLSLVAGVYWAAPTLPFSSFDDGLYVTKNQMVLEGLTLEGIREAFTPGFSTHWHPLTWLSLMLDVSLFGVEPGPMHVVNVLFHSLSVLLLFFIVRAMTRQYTDSFWPALVAAGLFAAHPLHVESVAWITERKDVLNGFLFLLSILFYLRYVWKYSRTGYVLSLVFAALSLMAKPTTVTLPFVLLLLDYWPLNRYEGKNTFKVAVRLVREKIPFFIVLAGAMYCIFQTSSLHDVVRNPTTHTLAVRLLNIPVSYLTYLRQFFWPDDLAIMYSFPLYIPPYKYYFSLTVLAALSILFFVMAYKKRKGYLFTGWFWFIGTMVPMIGIIPSGMWPAIANRFVYIPYMGIYIIIACVLAQTAGKRALRISIMTGACVAVLVLAFFAHKQVNRWHSTHVLYAQAVVAQKNNYQALYLLADVTPNSKDKTRMLREVLAITPYYGEAYTSLAFSLFAENKLEEAVEVGRLCLEKIPGHPTSHVLLANTLSRAKKYDEALEVTQKALEQFSSFARLHREEAEILFYLKQYDKALVSVNKSLQYNSYDISAYVVKSSILQATGRKDLAQETIAKGLSKKRTVKDFVWAARKSAEHGHNREALLFYDKALKLVPKERGLFIERIKFFLRTKQPDRAREEVLSFLKVYPDYPYGEFWLGHVAAEKGQWQKARAYYTELLKKFPEAQEAKEGLEAAEKALESEKN